MLVIGQMPAAYIPLHPADDLARCLRYFESTTILGGSGGIYTTGVGISTTNVAVAGFVYKARKAITPSISGASNWYATGTGGQLLGTLSPVNFTVDVCPGQIIFGGSIALGNAYSCYPQVSGSNLSMEANP